MDWYRLGLKLIAASLQLMIVREKNQFREGRQVILLILNANITFLYLYLISARVIGHGQMVQRHECHVTRDP